MFIYSFLLSAIMIANLSSYETISSENATSSPVTAIIQSNAEDQSLGDVYVQDADGNRTLANVYRSESGRIYCIFPQVKSRGSKNGTPQKYWASQSSKRGFRYEVYYNSKTWYFNL